MDEHLARASAALGQLRADNAPEASIHVLDSSAAGAFVWADGSIYVTRALVDLLSEDELSAAVAHELGHLLARQPAWRPAALPGGVAGGGDVECQADELACEVLQASGLAKDDLIRALAKVRGTRGLSSACRQSLARRIARLMQQP